MDRTVLVISALLLNMVLGGLQPWAAPLRLGRFTSFPATLIRNAERRLNRSHRSPEQRKLHGTLLAVTVIMAGLVAGWAGEALFTRNARFIEILLLALLLPVRQTWDFASQLHEALKQDNGAKAKQWLEGTIWRHYVLLDNHGLARAGIETLAVHFSEKILAPVLWYMVFGLPGLFISKSIYVLTETLAAMPAQQENAGFQTTPLSAHFLMHWLPARMAVLLWSLAVLFPPSGDVLGVLRTLAGAGATARTPQAVSVFAAAQALELSLGGPSSPYAGPQWLGTGTAKATPAHLLRARYLFALVHLFLFILLGLLL